MEKNRRRRREPLSKRIGCASVLLVVLSLFDILMISVARDAYEERGSVSWPSTDGRIEESFVNSFSRRDDGETYIVHMPMITYAYIVDGQTYRGNVVTFERNRREKESGVQWVERYPKGSSVAVYYNPVNRGKACLEPGIGRTVWWSPYVLAFVPSIIGFFLIAVILTDRWEIVTDQLDRL